MMRVGFVVSEYDGQWLGGGNYIRNLLGAICALPGRTIEPVLIMGRDGNFPLPVDVPPLEVIRTPLLDRKSLPWLIRKIGLRLFKTDYLLESLLRKKGVGLLSHSGYLGRKSRIPAICWIPDFQHRHLPQFFTPEELRVRDRNFMEICLHSSCVLLSSFAAQKDLSDFHPPSVAKSDVLQFTSDLGGVRAFPSLAELRERYGFTDRYFHLPNQFWAHKNHRLVVDALRILKSHGREVQVLATGNTRDLRQPEYFDSLVRHVEASDVSDCFKILGVVPFLDLMGLMRHSVAIINPSMFEGWSTTVEEAKSMGKVVVLSNIPVHLEQAPARGIFFELNSAESLAEAMWHAWSPHEPGAEEIHIEKALSALLTRKQMFGKKFEAIAMSVMGDDGQSVGAGNRNHEAAD